MTGEATALQIAINDARALLGTLLSSDLQDVHVIAGDTEIFVAREDGRPNPMRCSPPDPTLTVVMAPHIGTLVELAAMGTDVAQGASIGKLRVLDTVEEIVAPVAGRVVAVHAEVGALLEYATPIVSLLAALG